MQGQKRRQMTTSTPLLRDGHEFSLEQRTQRLLRKAAILIDGTPAVWDNQRKAAIVHFFPVCYRCFARKE